ncbi:MAG: lipopolysaccharide biosynthesis protein RfbH [Desulfuromonadales bacterium]
MQALKIIQRVSSDGYLHVKIPSYFSAKKVELIILPISDSQAEQASTTTRKPETEWDIDYETAEAVLGQTVHTFELMDIECGPEEPGTLEIAAGAVYWAEIVFTDVKESKVRPVVIMEVLAMDDYVCLPLTSNLSHLDNYDCLLEPADVIEGKIKRSRVVMKRACAIHRKLLSSNIAQLTAAALEKIQRHFILAKTANFHRTVHAASKQPFTPGDRIPYAGRVFDEKEVTTLVDSSLDFWLTTGRYAERFEKEFASFLGVQHCSLTNSGSSANLLAFMALTSPKLGDRRICRGDEVITVAAAFPTTVAPIIQYGAVPVFVDVSLPTYNIDVTQLNAALSGKTKAVMLAHTLGNPFDLAAVTSFCDSNHLWLIEDNCDALGSRYQLDGVWQYTGTIGHMGTSSFYPPHHMTMGEGGAVYTNDPQMKHIVESLRDWGRDCWCRSGHDNSCGRRFEHTFGELPSGYDHKYVYSHFGYNLKATDMQAAVGCAQLQKLPGFIAARKHNWCRLREGLAELAEMFILPEATPNSDPSWFGFLLTVREDAGFTRDQLVAYLEQSGIQTRMLFAGNLIKHPCFDEMRKSGNGYRIAGKLENTDIITRDSFWIGVYPGMTGEMIDYMAATVRTFAGMRT